MATLRDGCAVREALSALESLTYHSAQRAQAAVHACALEVLAALLRKLTGRGADDPAEEVDSEALPRQGCCACIAAIVRSCVDLPPLVQARLALHAHDARADDAVLDAVQAHLHDVYLAIHACFALRALHDARALRQGGAEVARVAVWVLQTHGDARAEAAREAGLLLCALLCRDAAEGGANDTVDACAVAGGTRAVLRAAHAHGADAPVQQACCSALSWLTGCACTTEAERAEAAEVALDALAAHAAAEPVCYAAVGALGQIWVDADAFGDAWASGPRRADAAVAVVSALRRYGTSDSIVPQAGDTLHRLTLEPAAQAAAADAGSAAALLAAMRATGVASSAITRSCCAALIPFLDKHAASSAAHAVDAFETVSVVTRAHAREVGCQVCGCGALTVICAAAPRAALGKETLNGALRWALYVLSQHLTDEDAAIVALRLLFGVLRKLAARELPLAIAGASGARAEAEVAAAVTKAAALHGSCLEVQRQACDVVCALSAERPQYNSVPLTGTPPGVLRLLASALLRHGIPRDGNQFVENVLGCLLQRLPYSRHPDGARLWNEALQCGLCEAVLMALCAGAGSPGDGASSAWLRDGLRRGALQLLFIFLQLAPPAVARRARACGAPALLRELLEHACSADANETTRTMVLQAASLPSEAEDDAAASVPPDDWEAYAMSGARCGHAGCGAEQCPDGSALKRCSRCRAAAYCCAEHQHAAWRTHKRICGVRAAVDAARREARAETAAAAASAAE